MDGYSTLQLIGYSAVALVVVCWLTVSFASAAALKRRLSWLGACGMYVALLCLFVSLFQGAESTAGRIGFGAMMALFGTGLCLALWKTTQVFAGAGSADGEHAAH